MGWNLDHYISPIHGFAIQTSSIFLCRLLSFLNYFAAQSSAWLRVFICLDRYLAVTRMHRTWFSHSKNILLIIGSIILIFTLLNLHFIIFGCSVTSNGEISIASAVFSVYPLWDYVNLGVYNCVPFILMIIFNTSIIYHLFLLHHNTTIQNSRIQHRSISITLLITTFLFLFMTVPATIAFGFFSTTNESILHFLDGILYSYHIISFPLYFITYNDFRRECLALITCRKNQQIVVPINQLRQV